MNTDTLYYCDFRRAQVGEIDIEENELFPVGADEIDREAYERFLKRQDWAGRKLSEGDRPVFAYRAPIRPEHRLEIQRRFADATLPAPVFYDEQGLELQGDLDEVKRGCLLLSAEPGEWTEL